MEAKRHAADYAVLICGLSPIFNLACGQKTQADQELAAMQPPALAVLNRTATGLRANSGELRCITRPEVPDINQQLRRESGGKSVIAIPCYPANLRAISR
jgi:hypothetical protein